jgi:hypothetical protein
MRRRDARYSRRRQPNTTTTPTARESNDQLVAGDFLMLSTAFRRARCLSMAHACYAIGEGRFGMVRSHKESCCQVPGTAGKVKVDALTTLLSVASRQTRFVYPTFNLQNAGEFVVENQTLFVYSTTPSIIQKQFRIEFCKRMNVDSMLRDSHVVTLQET